MNSNRGKRESANPDISNNLKACLVGILHNYSSPDTPLSVSQIADELNRLSDGSANISSVTLRKHLDELCLFSDSPLYSDFFKVIYGGSIIKYYLDQSSTRHHAVYIEAAEYEQRYTEGFASSNTKPVNAKSFNTKSQNAKSFYAFRSQFTANELFMLISSIQANPYFSLGDINVIKDKLITMSSQDLFRQACSSRTGSSALFTDSSSARLLENIGQLLGYIHSRYQIAINYGRYSINGTALASDRYPLTPTLTHPNGTPRWQRLDPIAIFEANGFYYLAAHTDKSERPDDIIAYRIDRIIKMHPFLDTLSRKPLLIDKKIEDFRNTFSGLEYKKSHPVMYAGDMTDIQLLVLEDANLNPVNAILDTFGRDVTIRPAADSDVLPHLGHTTAELAADGERWYFVHLHHSVSGTVLWAKQHIDNVLIISPQEAIDTLKSEVNRGLSRYK